MNLLPTANKFTMKNSFTLLSVCFLFLLLGLSSCKKDYVCTCTYANNTVMESYSFVINVTKSNAQAICYNEIYNPETYYPSDCYVN